MKRLVWACVVCFLFTACAVRKISKEYPVIPAIDSLTIKHGVFKIFDHAHFVDEEHLFTNEINDFNNFLGTYRSLIIGRPTDFNKVIRLIYPDTTDANSESYTMNIGEKEIRIMGSQNGV